MLNAAPKYVVSTTLTDLPWENSTLVPSVDELAALKEQLPGDLVVLGTAGACGSRRVGSS